MSQQLIYEIAGKRYVLVDIPLIEGHERKTKAFCEKYGMIFQGVVSIKQGWFSKSYVIQRMFLPEENFIAYSQGKI